MNTPYRILVAEDHTLVRMGIVSLLETERGLSVVGEADDGKAAVRLTLSLKPDVVIMDLMMPLMDGIQATGEIRRQLPDTKILILTTSTSSDDISSALRNGAQGAITKNAPYSELIAAIRDILAGKTSVSEEISHILSADPPVPNLSPRQAEVLNLIAKGLTNPDIARILRISLYTVKEQVNGIFLKLGATNRAEAVTIALRKHLLKI